MFPPIRKVFLGSLAIFLCAAGSLQGADPLEPPELDQYLRWGPLRVRPGFSVSNFGYDNNVFYDQSSPLSDLKATLSPRIEGLVLLGSRGFITFTEKLDYTLYKDFTELNALDHTGKYRLTVPFGDFGLFVSTELRRLHERPIDLQDVRAIGRSRRIGLGAIARFGWRTTLELEYSGTDFRYTDEDFSGLGTDFAEIKDRAESTGNLRLRYELFGRTRLTLDASLRTLEFDNPFLGSLPDVTRNLDQTTVLPGVDFGLGGTLSGTLRIGATTLDYVDPALEDYTGLAGKAALTYRFTNATRLTLNAERRVDFSVWENNSYFIEQSRGLKLVRFLNRFLGAEVGYSGGRLEIPQPIDGTTRLDDIRRYSLGLIFRMFENELGRKVEYTLRFTDFKRESSIDGLSLDRNTLSLSADVGF